MARTATQDNARRDGLITLRASPEERERLAELAALRGMEIAELVRDAVNRIARLKRRPHVFR
jgi:uncharacterized protein (DUF1778 family)